MEEKKKIKIRLTATIVLIISTIIIIIISTMLAYNISEIKSYRKKDKLDEIDYKKIIISESIIDKKNLGMTEVNICSDDIIKWSDRIIDSYDKYKIIMDEVNKINIKNLKIYGKEDDFNSGFFEKNNILILDAEMAFDGQTDLLHLEEEMNSIKVKLLGDSSLVLRYL